MFIVFRRLAPLLPTSYLAFTVCHTCPHGPRLPPPEPAIQRADIRPPEEVFRDVTDGSKGDKAKILFQ